MLLAQTRPNNAWPRVLLVPEEGEEEDRFSGGEALGPVSLRFRPGGIPGSRQATLGLARVRVRGLRHPRRTPGNFLMRPYRPAYACLMRSRLPTELTSTAIFINVPTPAAFTIPSRLHVHLHISG